MASVENNFEQCQDTQDFQGNKPILSIDWANQVDEKSPEYIKATKRTLKALENWDKHPK